MDYVKLAATAKRLIEKNGVAMTFSKLGRAPADPAKPWRGPVAAPSDPAENTDPVSYEGVKAVIVPIEWTKGDPSSSAIYGEGVSEEILARGISTLYVAATSFPEDHIDLRSLDFVNDGDTNWKIITAMPIKPGATEIIYQMLVEM